MFSTDIIYEVVIFSVGDTKQAQKWVNCSSKTRKTALF